MCGVKDIVLSFNDLREIGMSREQQPLWQAKVSFLAKSLKDCAKPALCSCAKLTFSGVEPSLFGESASGTSGTVSN